MKVNKVNYIGKDQSWENECTIYWFFLNGAMGDGLEFEGTIYGVCESGTDCWAVDCDNTPIQADRYDNLAVMRYCIVTNEMRAE